MARALDDRIKDRIIELLERGQSAANVAAELGCSVPMVYKTGNDRGFVFKGMGIMPEHGEEAIALVRGGESFQDVAKRFGCSKNAVADYCHKHGVRSSYEDHNQWGDYDRRLCRAVKVIEKYLPTFEYLSGFIDTDSPIDLRCKVCSTVKRVSMITVRKGKVACDLCRKVETEKRQQQRQTEKVIVQKERQEEKARKRLMNQIKTSKQMTFSFCSCGGLLPDARSKYCPDCSRRIANKRGELSRRMKLKTAWVDSDITVKTLFMRDGGQCWLCGGQCDNNDFIDRDGVIICGDQYPSIDHVIPLSKGGEHSWRNVRLAHRICNSLKSDHMPPGVEIFS